MGFNLNSNEPVKSSYLEKLNNPSIFDDAFMVEMINNSFYESKISFGRLIGRESYNKKRHM